MMEKDNAIQNGENQEIEVPTELSRRDFLLGLRKWSVAVIGVAVAGSVLLPGETVSGWVNGRGGGWINGGGGGGWVNRSGGGGGGSWINRRGY